MGTFQALLDVSNPRSANYGKYWSRAKICEKLDVKYTSEQIINFLKTYKSMKIDSTTFCGEYVTATARISTWEEILKTKFYVFQHDITNQTHIRAYKYMLSPQLKPLCSHVFHATDFPNEVAVQRFRQKGVEPQHSSNSALPPNGGVVEPLFLRRNYNVGDHVGSTKVTQTVFASLNISLSTADLSTFQLLFGIPQPIAGNIGGHVISRGCAGAACQEANLDVQYIMAMAPNVPTTFYYSETISFPLWLTAVLERENFSDVYSIRYVPPSLPHRLT
jgi:tripeptidyl-peptidase-1